MARSNPARVLADLCGRVPIMAVECRSNRHATAIEAAVDTWTARTGLAVGPREIERVRRARFGWLSAHTFSEASPEDAVLFGKWFVWYFLLDDVFDDGPYRDDPPSAVAGRCAEVMAPLWTSRGGTSPESRVLEQLWGETAARTSRSWQERFIAHTRDYARGLAEVAADRAAGVTPTEERHLWLRRSTNGPFLFDLPEAVLGTEVPPAIFASPMWQTLFDGSSDITAWCNDLASLDKDLAGAETHNYVIVTARTRDIDIDTAATLVADLIVERCAQIQHAASQVPELCAQHGLDHSDAAYLCRVACALVIFPRAHLDWLHTSARYNPEPAPSPR